MADKPQAVKVEALKYHTYQGKEYQAGDVYDFHPVDDANGGISADDQLAGLQATGFASRVDRAEVAKSQARAAAAKPAAAKPAKTKRAAKRK